MNKEISSIIKNDTWKLCKLPQNRKYIGIHFSEPYILVKCDNTRAINILKNPVMHSYTKHIAIKYHFLKENVGEGEVKLDVFMKIE